MRSKAQLGLLPDAAYAEEAERQLKSTSNSPDEGPSNKRQRVEAPGGRSRQQAEEEDDGPGVSANGSMQRVVDFAQLEDGYR